MNRIPLVVFACLCATPSYADTPDAPSFDRPGIAFSTGVLAPGTYALEQGLPDYSHATAGGITVDQYSADTNFRAGLFDHVELQIASAVLNHQHVHGAGLSTSDTGVGDASLAVKIGLPSTEQVSSAVLAQAVLPTGKDAFTIHSPEYDLGLAANAKVNEAISAGFYVNGSRYQRETAYTLSPSLSFSLNDQVGAFLEYGITHTPHVANDSIAGGGVTWLVRPNIQLDLSADVGTNKKSTDFQEGLGVSIFFQ